MLDGRTAQMLTVFPAQPYRARIVFDCQTVDDPAGMLLCSYQAAEPQ